MVIKKMQANNSLYALSHKKGCSRNQIRRTVFLTFYLIKTPDLSKV